MSHIQLLLPAAVALCTIKWLLPPNLDFVYKSCDFIDFYNLEVKDDHHLYRLNSKLAG